jgi:hypothetical protein
MAEEIRARFLQSAGICEELHGGEVAGKKETRRGEDEKDSEIAFHDLRMEITVLSFVYRGLQMFQIGELRFVLYAIEAVCAGCKDTKVLLL